MPLGREPRVEQAVGAGQRQRLAVEQPKLQLDADRRPVVAMKIDLGHGRVEG